MNLYSTGGIQADEHYSVWFIFLFALPHTFLSAHTHTHTQILLVKTVIKCLNPEKKNMSLLRSQLFTWNCDDIIEFDSLGFILSFIVNLCNRHCTRTTELHTASVCCTDV